jgi:hypothetical protein
MKLYQWYFFVLKGLILLQLVLVSAGFRVKESPFFAIVDTVFKVSLGLFLGFFFWPYPPKGMNWEDGLIISIGGFLILLEIEFEPIVALYEQRDSIIRYVVGSAAAATSAVKNE